MRLRLALWNVQWASPSSSRGKEVSRILHNCEADLICLTEGYAGLFPEQGHAITSSDDYGYPMQVGKRKVLLWSRWPWRDVDVIGSAALPSGRFVRGRVSTPTGQVTVIGVCIPWAHAHVSSGRRDRHPWEDHAIYLDGLAEILRAENAGGNVIVTGDFNQRIPGGRVVRNMQERLLRTFSELNICTAGPIAGVGQASIDHVAHSPGLLAVAISGWNAKAPGGRQLSDHFGLLVDFENLGSLVISDGA